MADKTPQNFANHTRWDPPFHFFAVPVFLITVLCSVWNAIQNPSAFASWWMVVLSIAALVAVLKARTNALKVQDRVIRLEERLRLAALLAEPARSRIGELTEGQLLALRFASDAEIPSLFEKTLTGNLPPKEIKSAIVNWRPDYFRV